MSALLDAVVDTFPANNDTGIPLLSALTITLSGLDYDETSLIEGLFVEGPDTDQYVGPGLLELTSPDNVSQGDINDFLQSAGYKGLVSGTNVVSTSGGNTIITFTPTNPLAPLIEYTVNLHSVLETDGITSIDGFVSFKFTTGSGSIEEVPATTSTSVFSSTTLADIGLSTSIPLEIVKTTPADLSVKNSPLLKQIIVEFNKDIDANSFTADDITISTEPASDHPNLSTTSYETLGKTVTVSGNKIIIDI